MPRAPVLLPWGDADSFVPEADQQRPGLVQAEHPDRFLHRRGRHGEGVLDARDVLEKAHGDIQADRPWRCTGFL